MGLFDALAKQALGGMLGGNQSGGADDLLSGLLQQAGGLNGLQDKFQGAGLQEVFMSWVSTDENKTVSAEQLQGVLGSDAIQGLAGRLGIEARTLLPLLSQYLPQVIDKLTPAGQIENDMPSGDQLQSVLSSVLKTGLGSLFGGGSKA